MELTARTCSLLCADLKCYPLTVTDCFNIFIIPLLSKVVSLNELRLQVYHHQVGNKKSLFCHFFQLL